MREHSGALWGGEAVPLVELYLPLQHQVSARQNMVGVKERIMKNRLLDEITLAAPRIVGGMVGWIMLLVLVLSSEPGGQRVVYAVGILGTVLTYGLITDAHPDDIKAVSTYAGWVVLIGLVALNAVHMMA